MLLPEQVNASTLLPFITRLGRSEMEDEIELDFTALRRVTPAGLAVLGAAVHRWKKNGRAVHFRGLSQCAITGYLQRMNLLRVCGVDLPEDFRRHDAKGRFVPLRLVDHPVDRMGHDMAACLAPGGEDWDQPMSGLYEMAWYVLTEAANNIRQHSGGTGFASAQVNGQEGFVRLALADNGMGILGSFKNAGMPWSTGMDDGSAIAKALEPRVSCKASDPNEGVGLTLVSELARLTKGWLLIVSGSGVLQILAGGGMKVSALPDSGFYRGTLFTLTLAQDSAKSFPQLLHDAKIRAGLLRTELARGRFTL
jgi:hypothetical protein